MNFFYVKQFPVLPPTVYSYADLFFIVPRVLELTYTAWDMKPFADDVWRVGAMHPQHNTSSSVIHPSQPGPSLTKYRGGDA